MWSRFPLRNLSAPSILGPSPRDQNGYDHHREHKRLAERETVNQLEYNAKEHGMDDGRHHGVCDPVRPAAGVVVAVAIPVAVGVAVPVGRIPGPSRARCL
jgi:hypothetical protein